MAKTKTNMFGFQFAAEETLGVLPSSPQWRKLQPDSPDTFGGEISTEARTPITAIRGRKKGPITDKDSNVEWSADLTMDSITDFAEGLIFSEFANKEFDLKSGGASPVPPPAVATTDDFTVDSVSTLLAGKLVYAVTGGRSMVFAKGYTNAANNGLHVLNVDAAGTDTTIQVASTLVAETPATKASLQVAGIEIDTADVTLTISGSTATLVSAAHVADWATLGWFPGMWIHFGSSVAGTGAVVNAFDDTGTDDNFGYARITSISGATANLDKLDVNLTATDTNVGLLHIMYGRFLRNVEVTATADDNEFLERSYQFEGSYPDLGGAGSTEYEYAKGNWANELALNIPLTSKATGTWGFVGTQTEDIVVAGSRKTNAANAVGVLRGVAFSTASDIASLSTDLITLVSDVCFKSLTLTIRNNVTPEKCLGTLGASSLNHGLFEVNLEAQMLFTNKEIINSLNSNTTVTFAAILKNEDGATVLDMPALTFKGGDREFPVGQTVLVNLTGESFDDPDGAVPDVSVGISFFASVPTVRPE